MLRKLVRQLACPDRLRSLDDARPRYVRVAKTNHGACFGVGDPCHLKAERIRTIGRPYSVFSVGVPYTRTIVGPAA